MKEVEIIASGKVQGVGYRSFVQAKAIELNIFGMVENKEDGSVEITAQGEEKNLNKFIEEIKKGTYFARVEDMDIVWHDKLSDPFTDFEII